MSDLWWDEVAPFFDPELMGALPDVRVPDTSAEDWQALLDLVGERDRKHRYSEGDTTLPVPRAKAVLARPAGAECPELRVHLSTDVLAIFRFHAAEEIDFDVTCGRSRDRSASMSSADFCGTSGDVWASRS